VELRAREGFLVFFTRVSQRLRADGEDALLLDVDFGGFARGATWEKTMTTTDEDDIDWPSPELVAFVRRRYFTEDTPEDVAVYAAMTFRVVIQHLSDDHGYDMNDSRKTLRADELFGQRMHELEHETGHELVREANRYATLRTSQDLPRN
jgi:hypothetical protein